MEDAYGQGYDAAAAGKSVADCPFDFGTDDYADWFDGFLDQGNK